MFGEIINGELILNEIGEIVRDEWIKSAEIRKEIKIHEYIVMPNHFHTIVEMAQPTIDDTTVGAEYLPPNNNENKSSIRAENIPPLRRPNCESGTLGAIVRGFKIGVTKKLGYSLWQRNYFEHIIRNNRSCQFIADYIENNSASWKKDRFFK